MNDSLAPVRRHHLLALPCIEHELVVDPHKQLLTGVARSLMTVLVMRPLVTELCRYLLRPPLGQERLEVLPDGQICGTLARPWSDGTQALLFTPVEFLEKLASLIPRPHVNLF